MVAMTVYVDDYNISYGLEDINALKKTNITPEEERAWLTSPHPRRGDIKIELTSPQGTKSVLLPYRDLDFINDEGYQSWPFTSVQHWGENPEGTWTLQVTYRSTSGHATIVGADLTLYGTNEIPQAVQDIPSECDIACKRGCSGVGSESCDACHIKRVSATLECVDECPNATILYKSHYCLPQHTSEVTTSPPSSTEPPLLSPHQLLVVIIGGSAGGLALIIMTTIVMCVYCVVCCKRKEHPSYVRLQFEDIPPTPV